MLPTTRGINNVLIGILTNERQTIPTLMYILNCIYVDRSILVLYTRRFVFFSPVYFLKQFYIHTLVISIVYVPIFNY